MKIVLMFLIFSLALPSYSFFEQKKVQDLKFHIGNWFEFPSQTRSSQSGETRIMEFAPFFASSIDYKLRSQVLLSPEVGYILQRTNEKIDKNQFFIRLEVSYLWSDHFRVSTGSSLMILNLSSDGGEESLPNGNSTATFYRPTESSSAFNQTLDFAIEYLFDNMGVKFQSYIYAWNESEERLSSFSLALTYGIPFKELL